MERGNEFEQEAQYIEAERNEEETAMASDIKADPTELPGEQEPVMYEGGMFSKPVGVNCAKCKPGVMFRITLSRLEEGLGHEGFRCNNCGRSVKYVKGVR